ncbi:MAG: hypothetical protein AAF581_12195 [Planctomycetota bacterium]
MSDQIIPKRPSSPIATTLLAVCAVAMIGAAVLGCMELKELRVDGKPVTESAAEFYGGSKADSDGVVKFKKGKLKKMQALVNTAIDDVPTATGGDDEDMDSEDG